jgi:hypothetical protein
MGGSEENDGEKEKKASRKTEICTEAKCKGLSWYIPARRTRRFGGGQNACRVELWIATRALARRNRGSAGELENSVKVLENDAVLMMGRRYSIRG